MVIVESGRYKPEPPGEGFLQSSKSSSPRVLRRRQGVAMSLLFLILACKPLTNLVRQMWFLPECHPNDYSECESNWVRGGITSKTQGSLDNPRSERMRAFASFIGPQPGQSVPSLMAVLRSEATRRSGIVEVVGVVHAA